MSYGLCAPTPPALPLDDCLDGERYIEQRCWCLASLQQALAVSQVKFVLAPELSVEMHVQLGWSPRDARNFFRQLRRAHYNRSEWALPRRHQGRFPAMAADSYVMGYDHIRDRELALKEPPVYFKFTFWPERDAILVLRAHLQTDPF